MCVFVNTSGSRCQVDKSVAGNGSDGGDSSEKKLERAMKRTFR
mgnify:CR=1 FL=1